MAKVSKNFKKHNNKNSEKYNADNEIIIGVTTKPKEKVRVDKKTTRTNNKKKNEVKNKSNKKNTNNTKVKPNKTKKVSKKRTNEEIKKINRKKVLISITALLFLITCGTIYYLTTPVFNVASIVVHGNDKNSIDTYISLSGININETNIFAFTQNGITKKIKENSYVEQVKIKRKLPSTLEIYITERKVDYQIKYLDKYIYVNNQGYVLEISEDKKDVIIIKGIDTIKNNVEVGKRLNNEDLSKLDTILKIVNYCKYNSLENKITNIDVTDTSNYTLIFGKDKKIAYLGDSSSITEKMTLVDNILDAEKGKEGIIHASEEELKRNRVYFSEKKIEVEEYYEQE